MANCKYCHVEVEFVKDEATDRWLIFNVKDGQKTDRHDCPKSPWAKERERRIRAEKKARSEAYLAEHPEIKAAARIRAEARNLEGQGIEKSHQES